MLAVKLNDDSFADPQMFDSARRVVDDLAVLGQRLEASEQLSSTYDEYQRLFGSNMFENKVLAESRSKWEDLSEAWSLIQAWTEKETNVKDGVFVNLDIQDLEKDVQNFYKDSFSIHKKVTMKRYLPSTSSVLTQY